MFDRYLVGQSVSIEHKGKKYNVLAETLYHFAIEDIAEGTRYVYSPSSHRVRPHNGTEWKDMHKESRPLLAVGKEAASLLPTK